LDDLDDLHSDTSDDDSHKWYYIIYFIYN
jgi:hypothetical protein